MSVPKVILEALQRQSRPSRVAPEGPVSRGDIRLIDWPGHDAMRSVLVVSVDSSDGMCEVLLLHNIVEYITDFDILISRAESGLPYALVAQLDIRGVVWTIDLGQALGTLSDDLGRFSIVAAANEDLRTGRGLKLSGPLDPRWQFKREEGLAMAEIAESCTAAMLSGDRIFAVSPETIDSLFDLDDTEFVSATSYVATLLVRKQLLVAPANDDMVDLKCLSSEAWAGRDSHFGHEFLGQLLRDDLLRRLTSNPEEINEIEVTQLSRKDLISA